MGGQGGAGVAQWYHPAAADVGGRAHGLRVHHAVVGGIRGVHDGEAGGVCRPVEIAGIDDRATDGGAVAANVLGEGVHGDIGAVIEDPAQHRRGHGIVDNQGHACGVGDVSPLADVDDIARRVADGLAEQGLGVFIYQVGNPVEVVGLGEAHLYALAREGVGKQVVGAAVQLRGTDDIAAHLGDGFDGVTYCRHAGGQGQGADAAFQFSQALLQDRVGGIHDTAVDIARYRQVEQIGAVLGVVESVGGSLVDRRGGGVGSRVAGVAGVQGNCFRFHGLSLYRWLDLRCGQQSLANGAALASPIRARPLPDPGLAGCATGCRVSVRPAAPWR